MTCFRSDFASCFLRLKSQTALLRLWKEGHYLFTSVCLSARVLKKLRADFGEIVGGEMVCYPSNIPLDFSGDLNRDPD